MILLIHAVGVGLTVAGMVALVTGRFRERRRLDVFFWLFMPACLGQGISLLLTSGCFLTEWEHALRIQANAGTNDAATFLEKYPPFLPAALIRAVPVLSLAAMIGGIV
ncbi:MAG: DUF2784 family protein [candidate division KSB1 bacterium]|nr:DUF2784 family protein [candidate division KSB1 bacterium]MDZ7275851.1 DUF2784 family protein [candidate division KSB1 bacterium]MDZ7287601.1 DUF2784 family protein [candidate division KSB1 bacterium]MDZ7306495.1 DUF2784 family protein [candidate division KSB1 bacterium]MDZ7350579.1 DUF2784 family protein [candidate division KSB1 bacterium]